VFCFDNALMIVEVGARGAGGHSDQFPASSDANRSEEKHGKA
jgi:hypothetical protein